MRCSPAEWEKSPSFKASKKSGGGARISQGESDAVAHSRYDVPRDARVFASLPCSRDRFS